MKKKKTAEFTMFELQGGPRDGLIIDLNFHKFPNQEFIACDTSDKGETWVSVYKMNPITKKALFTKTSKLK